MIIKGVTIRFPEDLLEKITFIAEYEGRSLNSHVLVLLREDIAKFEEANGRIEDDIRPASSVKPPRKTSI